MDEGRTAILVVRTRLTGARVATTEPAWARVTWLADVNDDSSQVTRHAGTRAGLHDMLEEWLDVIDAPRGPPGQTPRVGSTR